MKISIQHLRVFTMESRAFTIIEVMVSVIIISIVGLSLLKIHSNQTSTFEFARDRVKINERASIVISNYSENLEFKRENLYDLLKSKYPNIDSDSLIQTLKSTEFEVKKVELSRINPFSSYFEEEEEDEYISDLDELEQEESIILSRIDVRFEDFGTYLYSFEYENYEMRDEPSSNIPSTTTGDTQKDSSSSGKGGPPSTPSSNPPSIPTSSSGSIPMIGGN